MASTPSSWRASAGFDLISTDVVMPRLDGYELTRALRAMPEYADVPIVMVTSMGERIDRVRGFDAGVDEYITKPHDRTQLLRVVRRNCSATRRAAAATPRATTEARAARARTTATAAAQRSGRSGQPGPEQQPGSPDRKDSP